MSLVYGPMRLGIRRLPEQFFQSSTGAWFRLADSSTLYQTNDTSTPVTALGQQLGRITDKSGSGAHATQATAGLRPTVQARVNYIRSSEDITTGQHSFSAGGTAAGPQTVACDATNNAGIRPEFSTGGPTYTAPSVGTFVVSFELKQSVGSPITSLFLGIDPGNCTLTFTGGGVITLTGDWVRHEMTVTVTAVGTVWRGQIFRTGTGPVGNFDIRKIDVRSAAFAGYPYQASTSATNYSDVGLPKRLRSDFSDDVLSCTLASARDMYVSTPYGAYKSQANAGTVRLPLNDATEIVACATLSAAQEDALYRYFGVDEKYLVLLSSDTTIAGMRCYTGGGTTNILFVGANGVTVTKGLSLNSDTSYDVSTDGLTAPVAVVYPSGLITSTALTTFYCHTNQLTGSIPSLTANTALQQFYCYTNQLTGSIPSLTANTALTYFLCQANQLTGSIPSLTANTALINLSCHVNALTGSIPSLTANTALQQFYCNNNQLTGSIPSLTANTALQQFYCNNNQLTGSIPSLTANTALTAFYCNTNQLTGWTGGTVSATLGDFRAQDNLLTQAAVDAILAAFVAANKTTGTRVLNIGGTGNAAPSAAGVTDKDTLISRGWTVTTN